MCGIVGCLVFNNNNFRVTDTYVNRMRDLLYHRGPDSFGTWISPDSKFGVGHRRLSIIDLSDAASQPMCNEDGTLWVAFNGEIYNHREIRAELEKTNEHQWKTDHSDTEVILHAFEQWGIECIEKFRGMFAIALWDTKKKELWLIRDRLGIKPLYYSIQNGRLIFASEIKALLEDPDQKRELDLESFYHFLSFLTSPAPNTLFEGIRKLQTGTWIRIKENGHILEHKYWDVWDHTSPLINATEEEICQLILKELRDGVNLRKISDVPVGVFLSGGIDSSVNTALFSEGESAQIKTFTIGYRGDYKSYTNETYYASKMANEIGAKYHERIITVDDLIAFLPQMIYLQDEPIADPVCVPVYYVSKLARDNGVTVCQVGEGADELFYGYPGWKLRLWLQRCDKLPIPKKVKQLGLKTLQIFGKQNTTYYELLRRGSLGQPIFWGGAEAFNEMEKQTILSPRMRKHFSGLTSWDTLKPLRKHFEENAWEKSDLNWMSYLDLNLRLPELLLMRVDKMSMGVSLEARVPFLDHKFVELAMSIPSAIKTKNGNLKYILKKSVQNLIPDELIKRKKQGFSVPVYEWLSEALGNTINKEINSFLKDTDLFDPAGVKNLMLQKPNAKVWYLLNFALWWKQFIAA